MAVSISALIPRVRDLLADRPWETTSTTTTTSSTVAVPDGTLWDQGDIGEWQTGTVGGEQFYVQSVAGNNLTVVRGYAGTTAETHSSGDRVVKNPTYSYRQITQALTQGVNALWPFVYKTGTVTLTPSSTTVWYDLNASTEGVVAVVQQYGSSGQYVGRFGQRGNLPFEWDPNMPTALCASGKGMRFPSGLYDSSNSILVTDKRYVTGTSDIEDSGVLPVGDYLVHFACGILLQSAEIWRESGAALDNVATTVGTNQRLQTGAWFTAQAKKKLEMLAIKFEQKYQPVPMRRL